MSKDPALLHYNDTNFSLFMTRIQKWALGFGVLFLLVFVVTNIPAFNDAEGRNFGLFAINPIDNIVHLLTAVLGLLAGYFSARWSVWFFRLSGLVYGADTLTGLFLQRGFLDGTVFTLSGGSPDFGLTNIAINAPHIALTAVMLYVGFSYYRKLCAAEMRRV